MKFNHYLNTIA